MGMLGLFLQSFSSISLLGVLVVLLLVYVISKSSSQGHGKGPPGPMPFPVLGNLPQLDILRPYNSLIELSKKYGSVFTVYLGSQKVVVLAGYKTVKEALAKNAVEFGDRDPPLIFSQNYNGHGVLWANGEAWKDMRRFVLTNLRDFGMGKKSSEEKIMEECEYLIEELKKFKGEPFDTTKPIRYAVSNFIYSLVLGSRFEYDDQEFTSLVNKISKTIELAGSPSVQIYNIFPWIGKWIKNRNEFNELNDAIKVQNLKLCNRLKETLNPQMCRGFVDAFLVQKQKLEESGTNSYFHNDNLIITALNLFNAGTDTTSAVMRWSLLFMAKYPKIQEQVKEELRRVIGTRRVQFEDRKNLPFTDAVIHETQRLANIVPLSLPHKTSKDVTFQGHFIEKGTTVYPLLTSVLYDESEWEKPRSFYPAHFLDKDGKFVKPDAFIPFSAGRRICLGESMAKMQLFIFFTTLMQHFRFSPPPGVSEDELDLSPLAGIILNPSPHKLCADYCM